MKKIRCDYILRNIITGCLATKRYLQIAQYNKNLQKRLDISIKDYKHFFNRIIIELTPKLVLTRNKNIFINIKDKEKSFFHIFFDNSIFEEKRTYITPDDKIKKIKIIIDNKIKSLKGLFHGCSCIKGINIIRCENGIQNLYGTFSNCSSLMYLDVSKMKTDNVKTMRDMFFGCKSLRKINLNNFNTKNVTSMQGMFSCCSFLKDLIIDKFDTSKVKSMADMFYKCSRLRKLNVSNFNTENVNYMRYMFYHCNSLNNLDCKNFKLDNVTKMDYMFSGCKKEFQEKIKNQNNGFKEIAFDRNYH